MKNKGTGVKTLIIGIILLCIVLGYYYYLSNRQRNSGEEAAVTTTAVQEVLLYNLDKRYPPTPKEVVKFFGEISKCFYNESYTEEEFLQLASKIQILYDDELVASKTQEQYIKDLREDIDEWKGLGMVISSYSVSASTDVERFTKDGYEWARLYCSFTLRTGTKLGTSNEVFLLRKDKEGHWKIYGWDQDKEG